jgi:hypothetical protein
MRIILAERTSRLPRIWSNRQLEKFAGLFSGDVVNVSAWKDEDKEGRRYKDYFVNASSYTVTNWNAEARGLQGLEGELFLDLEARLPENLNNRFDVVYNHTTLEHIYDIQTAFSNLCLMSKDIVILCVPFLQPFHGDYGDLGDYWRFTPLCVKRLFEQNHLTLLYLNYNNHRWSSVYVFAVASKLPQRWQDRLEREGVGPVPGRQRIKKYGDPGERAIPVAWNKFLRKLLSAFGMRSFN